VPAREDLPAVVDRLELHIAIDGPAGAGKSTVGRGLARHLRCGYLDTGLMYRALASKALQLGINVADSTAMAALAGRMHFSLGAGPDAVLAIDGSPAGADLKTPEVDRAVSAASAHREVRATMVAWQRRFAEGRALVMVGRDIGTIVLPDAPVKLWITASAEERARRRQLERTDRSTDSWIAAVDQLTARDLYDSTRPVSPSVPASDAIVLETDAMSEADVLARALRVVVEAVNRLEAGDRQTTDAVQS
jgi:cytidylate kinase